MFRAGFLAVSALSAAAACGQVLPMDPFLGDVRDDYTGYTTNLPGLIDSAITVLDGHMTVRSHDGRTFVHLITSSNLGGDLVQPRSPSYMLGVTEGPMIWEFHRPARAIGAWWESNAGLSGAVATFFNESGDVIGEQAVNIPAQGQQWVWNGWSSSEGIARISFDGNGVLNGFIWTDDVEYIAIPEPAAGLLVLAGLGFLRRRAP
ncbi:MAG: hypothetical protein AMXMBFR47_31160 [Planctomycetota bacterium]